MDLVAAPLGRPDQNRLPTEFLGCDGHELGYPLVLPAAALLPLLLVPDMLPFATALRCQCIIMPSFSFGLTSTATASAPKPVWLPHCGFWRQR